MNSLIELEKASEDFRLISLKQELEEQLAQVKGFIVTKETKADASNRLGSLKKLQKNIDERRKEIVKPFQDAISNLKKSLDVLIEPVMLAEIDLTKKLNDFITAEKIEAERKIKEEQERIRIEAEKALETINTEAGVSQDEVAEGIIKKAQLDMKLIENYTNTEIKVKGEMFNTSQRTTFKAEVVDQEAFLKWVLKTKQFFYIEFIQGKINGYAKNVGEEKVENGLKIYKENTIVSR